jgi:fructose-bisphosphate aldolase, class I
MLGRKEKLMDSQSLFKLGMVAKKLVEGKKGLLAADETPETLGKRFCKAGVENTEENRRRFRELLFTTRDIEKYVSGVILHEETFSQKDGRGKLLVECLREKGVSIGIKLDKGLIDYREREKVSVGLEDLDKRCRIPKLRTAEFAKWRSLFYVSEDIPTEDCIQENCSVLARYAAACQNNGLVPIVEPEICFEGDYTIERAERLFRQIMGVLVKCLNEEMAYMPGILIKTSFVTPGSLSAQKCSVQHIGEVTLQALLATIPCAVTGVVFLSGGHSTKDAVACLGAVAAAKGCRTWSLSFSFARALTEGPLLKWKGEDANADDAGRTFLELLYQASQATHPGEG